MMLGSLPSARLAQRVALSLSTLAALSLAALALGGCTGAGFEIDFPIPEQTIPGSPVGGDLASAGELSVPLDIDLEAARQANGAGAIRRVRVAGLSIWVTATSEGGGDTDDLGFIDGAEFYVQGAAGSSLPRIRIGALADVPDGTRSIAVSTEPDADLLPYIQEGGDLIISASGTLPPDDVTIGGLATLAIEVL